MPEDVGHDRVQRLQADGASIVEVLPRDEYEREHLAGALSLPLGELGRASVERALVADRAGGPVLANSWQQARNSASTSSGR